MFTATMSTKGQLTLPKAVRDRLKLRAGTKVVGSIDDRGRLLLVPALYEPEELFRDRPAVARSLTSEEMDDAIARATR